MIKDSLTCSVMLSFFISFRKSEVKYGEESIQKDSIDELCCRATYDCSRDDVAGR